MTLWQCVAAIRRRARIASRARRRSEMLDEIRNDWPGEYSFPAYATEKVKEYARAQLALVSDTQKIIMDRTTAMGNWLVASLLLLNAGAALASHSAAGHGGGTDCCAG